MPACKNFDKNSENKHTKTKQQTSEKNSGSIIWVNPTFAEEKYWHFPPNQFSGEKLKSQKILKSKGELKFGSQKNAFKEFWAAHISKDYFFLSASQN